MSLPGAPAHGVPRVAPARSTNLAGARSERVTGSLVALGDSMSCGEGVGVHVPLHLSWPALLAKSHALQHVSLAVPGARARDVLAGQVGLLARPDVVTLLIGLNDVLRSSDCAVGETLTEILSVAGRPTHGLPSGAPAEAPRGAGPVGGPPACCPPGAAPTLLVVRLHDPTALLPLPRRARAAVLRRVGQVNAAVDQAASVTGAVVLDLAGLPALQRRAAWAVDRLHPSAWGHAVIATAAADLLRTTPAWSAPACPAPARPAPACSAPACAEGVPVPGPEGDRAVAVPGRLDELVWLTRHGFPYLAVHGRRMVPGLVTGLTRR